MQLADLYDGNTIHIFLTRWSIAGTANCSHLRMVCAALMVGSVEL